MNLLELKKEMLSKGIRLSETYYISADDDSLQVSVEAVYYHGAIATSEQSAECMEDNEQAIKVYQNLYDSLKVNMDYDEINMKFKKVGYNPPTTKEDPNE